MEMISQFKWTRLELTSQTQRGVRLRRRLRLALLLGLLAITLVVGYRRVTTRYVRDDVDARAQIAKAVVVDLVDNAVLKTLELLATNTEGLHQAAVNLQADPNAEHLGATVDAWHRSLGAWNLSVTYQYGPATQYDYHKRLATWPCDKVLIEHALDNIKTGQLQIDARFLREQRFATQRGLYTIQYLLFRNGQPREAASFSPAELTYLAAATKTLHEESIDFEASWRGTENLAPEKLAIIKAAGIPDRSGYAQEFKNPGLPGSRYASLATPLQEVFQDISGAIEDIAPAIDELLDAMDAHAYWDSIDPCDDLLNQLRSIENTYLGGVDGFRGRSLSELVAAHDASLDRLIKISIAHTEHRTAAIRDSKDKSQEEIELAVRVAQAELEKLNARVNVAAPLVILDPAVKPYAAYR